MRKLFMMHWIVALALLLTAFVAHADANPFDGAAWDTGIMTGTTPTITAEHVETPQATPAPGSEADKPVSPVQTQAPLTTPSSATYRYLTCRQGSGVPLYPTATSVKESTCLTRGDLVLVHEYAHGRARITFGGWKGWVDSSALTSHDPNTGEKVGYRYAYDESGSVPLYRYGFEDTIAFIPSGAKVAITDMKENGHVYVMHGAISGWMKSTHLVKKLPSGVESQEGRSYYYCTLIGDHTDQAVQLYSDSSCGSKCGTLAAGTVVKVLDTQLNIHISYGGKEYYVKPRNVFRELSSSDSGGIETGVTAPAMEDQPEEDTNQPDTSDTVAAGNSAGKKSNSRSSTSTQKSQPKRISVEIKYLGVVESCIIDSTGERMVSTADLAFASEASTDKRIAYIYAPNTGKCSLWKKASKKSDLIKKCKAGTVVMVLDYGSKFCKVMYDGKAGYVLTSCLRFPGADVVTIGTGKISYKGKTNGTTTVNIRGAGNGDARRIAEWRTGTEVTVFSYQNGWYEVESKGIHGWVQDKFLTVDE